MAARDRAGFTGLLWAEFTKFCTVRGWVIALCAAAVVFVLLSYLSAWESRYAEPSVPTGPGGEAVSDTYMFVHRTLAGDGTLTARVTSLSGAHTSPSPAPVNGFSASSKGQLGSQLEPGPAPWAKAGIILEADTNQGTGYAAVMVAGSHGVRMQYNYTHDSPGIADAAGPSSPRWLRLARAGDVLIPPGCAGARQCRSASSTVGSRAPVVVPAGSHTSTARGTPSGIRICRDCNRGSTALAAESRATLPTATQPHRYEALCGAPNRATGRQSTDSGPSHDA